ncbi:PIN domain-containing protein [Neorhizobium lilium]|uniref:PIN domain-containing protein n=1 Tax=Neorhizobium lilium TaxID=2503024 RepID=A0A3S3RVS3_9HYPH|nr:PIN domain-containing protein [Neorhizobium lilium]
MILDTNILLRAALDDDPRQSNIAQGCLADADEIAIPLPVFCEFVWVLSRSYKLRKEMVISAVLRLINSSNVTCDEEAVEAGLAFLQAGGDFADGVIEFEGRKLGGTRFVTFDRQAASIVRDKGREVVLLDAG